MTRSSAGGMTRTVPARCNYFVAGAVGVAVGAVVAAGFVVCFFACFLANGAAGALLPVVAAGACAAKDMPAAARVRVKPMMVF